MFGESGLQWNGRNKGKESRWHQADSVLRHTRTSKRRPPLRNESGPSNTCPSVSVLLWEKRAPRPLVNVAALGPESVTRKNPGRTRIFAENSPLCTYEGVSRPP